MKQENASSFLAIAMAFLATSCCLGPAIFLVFGTSIGFLGEFSFLSPLRPYFLGFAYVVLGFVLSETEMRTRQFFSGLAVIIRESVEKFASWLRDIIQGTNCNGSGNRGY